MTFQGWYHSVRKDIGILDKYPTVYSSRPSPYLSLTSQPTDASILYVLAHLFLQLEPPPAYEMASLSQLLSGQGEDGAARVFGPIPGISADGASGSAREQLSVSELSEEDLRVLGKWINPEYLRAKARGYAQSYHGVRDMNCSCDTIEGVSIQGTTHTHALSRAGVGDGEPQVQGGQQPAAEGLPADGAHRVGTRVGAPASRRDEYHALARKSCAAKHAESTSADDRCLPSLPLTPLHPTGCRGPAACGGGGGGQRGQARRRRGPEPLGGVRAGLDRRGAQCPRIRAALRGHLPCYVSIVCLPLAPCCGVPGSARAAAAHLQRPLIALSVSPRFSLSLTPEPTPPASSQPPGPPAQAALPLLHGQARVAGQRAGGGRLARGGRRRQRPRHGPGWAAAGASVAPAFPLPFHPPHTAPSRIIPLSSSLSPSQL